MKIMLLYTPRSGSTSILKYFEKVKTNYECFNEPWFDWMIKNVHQNKLEYLELVKKDNIFVKSAYKTLPISLNELISDFDKVIILLRKNKKEQIESSILVHFEENFLNTTPRKYNIHNITEIDFEKISERYDFLNETLSNFALLHNLPVFYYEDLYYNDFTPLFNELNIEYNEDYFNEYLNISKRYRIGDIEIKNNKTLI